MIDRVDVSEMVVLRICLFGMSQIKLDDGPVPGLKSIKAQALLFYLAANGRPYSRAALATLLWGDTPDAAARGSLRKALQQLRRHLGDYLTIERETVSLAAEANIRVDVSEFAAAREQDRLHDAVDLYEGDLLEGFYVRGAPDFEAWMLAERARLREQALEALRTLAARRAAVGDLDEAIALTRRFLALEPWREHAHRRLMEWLALSGQRAAALAQYEICRRVLAEELDVEPSPETIELAECIREGKLSPAGIPAPAVGVKPYRPAFLDQEDPLDDIAAESLVGRDVQLARLATMLETAQRGRGQVAFVSGEAGWGKTCLLAEFSHRAQTQNPDLIVVSGVCTTSTGVGDPYLPFRDLLRMLVADVEQKWQAGVITRDHARRLWRFFPQVIAALTRYSPRLIDVFLPGDMLLQQAAAHDGVDASLRAQLQAAAQHARNHSVSLEQERIFAELSAMLQALAGQQPLLLILDDLHWADASSIYLLFHLARRLRDSPVLILGAYRPEDVALLREGEEHPLQAPLNEFRRTYGDVWVHLDQAEPEAGRAFVDALVDATPNHLGKAFRQALFQHTHGHPLFTVETLRDMRERGDLILDEQGRWIEGAALDWSQLPARIEGVIETRFLRLDPDLRRSLAVASVEGEIFTAQVVANVRKLDDRDLTRRLSREADKRHRLVQEEGIVRVDGRRLSRYRFRHNLFQRYLYSDLSEAERAYLHEDVGKALEALFEDRTDEIAVDLAFHFQAADLPHRAILYLSMAGERAIRLAAHEEAIILLTRALALLPASSDQDPWALTLNLALGKAQRNAGQTAAALQTFVRAAAAARALDSAPGLARAALGYEETRWRPNLPAEPAAALLEEALLALGQEEDVLRVRVLGALARARTASGEMTHVRDTIQEAIAAARRLGEPLALYDVLQISFYADRRPEESADRIVVTSEMIRLAETIDDQERLANALGSHIHEHLERGDISSVDAVLAIRERVARELNQPFHLHTQAVFQATRTLLAGHFAEGERMARHALEIGQRMDVENAAGTYGFQMFTIRREQGRLGEMTPVIEHFVAQHSLAATWRPGLALIYSDLGMVKKARAQFDTLATGDFADLSRDAFWVATLVYLSEVCAFLDDAQGAAALYRLFLPYDGLNTVVGFGAASYGAVSRYLGLLAATQQRWDQAEHHFEDALAMNGRMGAKPWLAHTQADYAAMLRARNQPGDREQASVLLNAARRIAQQLAMQNLIAKISSLDPQTDHPH